MCPRWPSPSSRCSSSDRCRRCWRARPGRCGRRGPRSCCGSRSRWPRCCRRSARASRSPAGSSSPVPTAGPTATITSEIEVLGWPLWIALRRGLRAHAADRRPARRGRRAGGDRHPTAAGASPDGRRPASAGRTTRPTRRASGLRILDVAQPLAYCLPGVRSRVVVSEGTLTTLSDREIAAILQPRARAPAGPPRPGARDVHRRARRLPPLRPQRQRARRGAAAHRTARRRRRGAHRGPHSPGPGPGRVRVGPTPRRVRSPRAVRTTVLRVRRLGGQPNSVSLAVAAYVAAAAVLVVPTVALAVPWLTELHRLFTALDVICRIPVPYNQTTKGCP